MINFHNKHPIVLLNYVPRVVGHALTMMVVTSALLAQNYHGVSVFIAVISISLIWPNIALYFAYNSPDPKRLEMKFIFIDCFIYGVFAALAAYSIGLVVCFTFCLLNSALSLKGIPQAIGAMLSMLAGMIIVPLIFGLYINFYTDTRTIILIVITMYTYISVTGYLTFTRNKAGKRTRERLRETLADLAHINKVLQTCNLSLKVDHVMRILIDSLQSNIFKFDTLTFQAFDQETKLLVFKAVDDPLISSIAYDTLNNISISVDEKALATEIFKNMTPCYMKDIKFDESHKIDKQIQSLLLYCSALAFPVTIRNKCIGIISFYSRKTMELTPYQINKIQDYINQVSLIINNALLHEQIRSKQLEISFKNKQLQSISTHLAKYISPQVFDKIMNGEVNLRIGSKKKLLTIFFSDIVSFTEMSDRLDSEKLTGMLNVYLDAMTKIALNYGGTIDKYIGDSIMVFFGDPGSRGPATDAYHATLMALEMMGKIKELKTQWEKMGIHENLQIRIGINTGFCSVGNFGSDFRMDYTIIGSPVNLTIRLMATGAPGEIIVSNDTWLLIKDKVECEKKSSLEIKDLAQPLKTFVVMHAMDDVQ